MHNAWGEHTTYKYFPVSSKLWHCSCMGMRLEEQTCKLLILFLERTAGTDPENLRGVCMEDNALAEDIVAADIFLYDIETVHGSKISVLARSRVGKCWNTVQLLCDNSHSYNVSNINARLKAYRCPSYGYFIIITSYLERHFTACK